MNFQPLADRIMVHRVEEVANSAIIIPDVAKEKPQRGEVIAVGEGRYVDGVLRPLTLQVGDRILFGKYSGAEIKIDGIEYLIMKEDDVYGVLK